MELKCAPCTDQAITDGQESGELAGIADAWTLVTVIQEFGVNGQQIAAPCTVPVCYPCRKTMLNSVSKTGLAVA